MTARSPAWLLLLPVVLLLGLAVASAEEDSPPAPASELTLRVGKPRLWSPGYACMMIVCDDRTVVRVEDARTTLRLIGLRPGTTRCGFWRDEGYRRVMTIHVKP